MTEMEPPQNQTQNQINQLMYDFVSDVSTEVLRLKKREKLFRKVLEIVFKITDEDILEVDQFEHYINEELSKINKAMFKSKREEDFFEEIRKIKDPNIDYVPPPYTLYRYESDKSDKVEKSIDEDKRKKEFFEAISHLEKPNMNHVLYPFYKSDSDKLS